VAVAALEIAFVLAGYFAYRRESTKREQAVPA
jgi:hypothetical protein